MKNLFRILAILIFIGCNSEPKQPEQLADEPGAKTPPPAGLGVVAQPQARMGIMSALAAMPDSTRVLPSGDTLVYYNEIKTVNAQVQYKAPYFIVKAKSTTPTTPPVTPPPATGTSKLLALTNIRTTGMRITTDGTVIENTIFRNIDGNGLYIKAKNVIVRNCFFDKGTQEAIVFEDATNGTVENCLFNGVTTGVYALSSTTIKVNNNEFVNVRQRSSGGRGQFVQFNGVGGAGCSISNNKGENFLGESDPEDMISLFKSSGTASSPILVKNNVFRGGGPSASGGGIIGGDYGGGYQVFENNILIDPGQYGMAIAGGQNISILNNIIVAKQQPFTNNPLYMWAQQGASCSNHTVKGNKVFWIDRSGGFNGGWDAGNCGGSSFEYPAKFKSYEEGIAATGIKGHFLQYVNAAELLKIRGK